LQNTTIAQHHFDDGNYRRDVVIAYYRSSRPAPGSYRNQRNPGLISKRSR
jgi:hypothetical protein